MIGKMDIYHYWIAEDGYYFSWSSKKPEKKGKNLKYIGYTTTMSWPKIMSTGRVFHKFKRKKRSKNMKKLIPKKITP